VPDHQLSLAIGKEGQNARLSAKLTGWRIDIKSESQAKETGFITEDGEFPENDIVKNDEEIEFEDEMLEDELEDGISEEIDDVESLEEE